MLVYCRCLYILSQANNIRPGTVLRKPNAFGIRLIGHEIVTVVIFDIVQTIKTGRIDGTGVTSVLIFTK